MQGLPVSMVFQRPIHEPVRPTPLTSVRRNPPGMLDDEDTSAAAAVVAPDASANAKDLRREEEVKTVPGNWERYQSKCLGPDSIDKTIASKMAPKAFLKRTPVPTGIGGTFCLRRSQPQAYMPLFSIIARKVKKLEELTNNLKK